MSSDTEYVILYWDLAGYHIGPGEPPRRGAFLAGYDPDGHGGRGAVTWTTDWHQAWLFESHKAAFNTWRATSKVRPVRGDGKPNRPLTACSVEVVTLAQALGQGLL
jgi:hypothetical protein